MELEDDVINLIYLELKKKLNPIQMMSGLVYKNVVLAKLVKAAVCKIAIPGAHPGYHSKNS